MMFDRASSCGISSSTQLDTRSEVGRCASCSKHQAKVNYATIVERAHLSLGWQWHFADKIADVALDRKRRLAQPDPVNLRPGAIKTRTTADAGGARRVGSRASDERNTKHKKD